MKKIRVDFAAFHGGFDKTDNPITNLLQKHFEVEIGPDPDFLFSADFWYGAGQLDLYKTDCIRIGYTGENAGADFNTYDYFIGFHRLDYPDRYCRFPNLLFDCDLADYTPLANPAEFSAQKNIFCNFCFSHLSESGAREKMVELLSDYKQVSCYGPFLNNTSPTPQRISREEKAQVVARSKFTICCESTSRDGFVTEKIWDAFKNHSIPIYWGDPGIVDLFDPKAFVNMHDFASWEEAAAFVKQLDQDENAYLEMLSRAPLTDPAAQSKALACLEEFLVHICSQTPIEALRRPACFMPKQAEEYLALLKPYARKLDKKEQIQFRWRQRWYWGLVLLHRLLPNLVAEPDKGLLDFYYKRADRARNA